jgi:hypothetical protein
VRSEKLIRLTLKGISFSTPLATQDAPRQSEFGMDAPVDEEMEAVFDEIAVRLHGRFNDFDDGSGATRYDWQFHLPENVSIGQMRRTMTGLGFTEFVNLNLKSHRPTLPFDLGGIHWKGNIRGNWYHIEFRRRSWLSRSVNAVDAHYDADRPSFIFHRTATGKQKPILAGDLTD